MRRVVDEEARDRLEELQTRLEEVSEEQNWLDSVVYKRIIVHTKDDQSFDGTLMAQMSDGLILRAAKLLGPGMQDTTTATALPGEVWIPRANIAFCQFDEG